MYFNRGVISYSLIWYNKRFARLRGLVELPFAFIKHHMNFRQTRYLGITKNQEHFYLLATCYNLRRIPALVRSSG